MAMLLLEAKPSLEGKVKAGGPGASPSPTWDFLMLGCCYGDTKVAP